jgi:hypothetical protein
MLYNHWFCRGIIGNQMMYLQSGFTNSKPIVKINAFTFLF